MRGMTTTAQTIRTATSREQAAQVLAPLTRAQLVTVAAELGIHHGARDTAPRIRHLVLFFGVTRRLNSAAISRPA